jgi:MEMO1 family protein
MIDNSLGIKDSTNWKTVILPHDDYAYVQYLYPAALKNLKAKTIFIIGIADKAKSLNIENKIIFDFYNCWNEPFGKVKISDFRDDLISKLDKSSYCVSDSMYKIEHSVETYIPILQYYHNDFQIVPILVPYMLPETMKNVSRQLADFIFELAESKHLKWGKDFAILISSDAVYYGDKGWEGKNYSFFGSDSESYIKAKQHEIEIIKNCLLNGLDIKKIDKLIKFTVLDRDYKEHKYNWYGRYSIPFGLLVSNYLQELYKIKLKDKFIGYSTSIELPPLDTTGLGIGFTYPANIHHWVGYVTVGYE